MMLDVPEKMEEVLGAREWGRRGVGGSCEVTSRAVESVEARGVEVLE